MQRTRIGGVRASLLTVMASSMLLCGCGGTGGAEGSDAYAAAVKKPCAGERGTVLHADVDGDGRADVVTDPGRDSSRTRVAFGGGKTVRPGALVAPNGSGLAAASTFADFDGDGHLDMAVAAGRRDTTDDPAASAGRVQEIRFGPLGADLKGASRTRIAFDDDLFVWGLRASDADHDGRADLAVFRTAGDGQVARYDVTFDRRRARTGQQDGDNAYDVPHWPQRYKPGWSDFGTCTGD
ncbi:FG-GAP repeat domain-containing protein [Streptomyces sp. NPDC051684]|uniref:FG-GAP repeat domain-containing protein n=1 Tax=Streptomyces sp. NPDC051684 TaxID=3365670 RepID=UPI003797229D